MRPPHTLLGVPVWCPCWTGEGHGAGLSSESGKVWEPPAGGPQCGERRSLEAALLGREWPG